LSPELRAIADNSDAIAKEVALQPRKMEQLQSTEDGEFF
jgi:hypothetical protein